MAFQLTTFPTFVRIKDTANGKTYFLTSAAHAAFDYNTKVGIQARAVAAAEFVLNSQGEIVKSSCKQDVLVQTYFNHRAE